MQLMRLGLLGLLGLCLAACQPRAAPAADDPVAAAVSPGPEGILAPPFTLGAGFPHSHTADRASTRPLQEGEPAPGFSLVFADGTSVSLAELQGRALLVNFWATWCGPCRHEIPLLLAEQAAFPDELLVLAVNVREDRAMVEEFAREFTMEIPIVLDPDGAVVALFQVRGYPTSVFIDARGDLVATWRGVLDARKLRELVEATLAAGNAAS